MIEIINCYSNLAMPGTELIGKHGQSFLIKVDNDQILIDTGADGPTLLHNMKILGINPNDITHLILTHGHYDHTGGLKSFIERFGNDFVLYVSGKFFDKKYGFDGIAFEYLGNEFDLQYGRCFIYAFLQ